MSWKRRLILEMQILGTDGAPAAARQLLVISANLLHTLLPPGFVLPAALPVASSPFNAFGAAHVVHE